MEMNKKLLEILEDITGTDEVRSNPDLPLFEEELLDSLGAVQLLVAIEASFGITVPISSFDRETWATPALILEKVASLSCD